ncbi:kinase-like domain-containing protein, partial [Mycena belliarum]
AYIHSEGVCHRDLKPENILLDAAGCLKISDFGLAVVFRVKGSTRQLTYRSGTPGYVAPEVLLRDLPYDAQPPDMWATGIILYTLLSGNTPWDKPDRSSAEYSAYLSGRLLQYEPWVTFSPPALSLLRGLLTVEPNKRLSMDQARSHPWFTSYVPSDAPNRQTAPAPLRPLRQHRPGIDPHSREDNPRPSNPYPEAGPHGLQLSSPQQPSPLHKLSSPSPPPCTFAPPSRPALQFLENLPSPTADDTPRTVDAWRKLHDACLGTALATTTTTRRKWQDQLHEKDEAPEHDDDRRSASAEPSQNDGDEEDDGNSSAGPENAQQKKDRRAAAIHLRVTKRAQKIVASVGEAPLSAEELLDLVTATAPYTAEGLEDGFPLPPRPRLRRPQNHMAVLAPHLSKAAPTHAEFCQKSTTLDGGTDLVARDINLTQSSALTEVDAYLAHIIHKVETIKFAVEWDKNIGPGGQQAKARYNRDLFQSRHPYVFSSLTDAEKTQKMHDMKVTFTDFKKKRESLVTGRNRLLKAFTSVRSTSSYPFSSRRQRLSQFGTGVLLHPFFRPDNLGDRRAKKFASLLDMLLELAPDSSTRDPRQTVFHDLEGKNRVVLYNLVTALAHDDDESETVCTWLDDFYIKYPTSIVPNTPDDDE